jgi:hypothetical protein
MHAQYARPIWFDNDPPMPELRKRLEKEFNYRASAGQLLRIDPALQIVHEHLDVELVVVHLTARPSHSPFTKAEDDRLELFARSSGMIFDSPLIGHRFPDNEASLFKLVETFSQQSWRDLRQRALEIVEARRAEDKLANNEKCPAFAQKFGSLGHRTDLTVADAHQREAKHYIQSS